MNDRIRELYQQAHSIRYHDGDPMRDGDPPTVYWQGEKSAEKFAELIVQECVGVLSLTKDGVMKMNLNGAMLKLVEGIGKAYSTGIKEHFYGVEE